MGIFFFKQKTAYEIEYGLVGSEMCIRDRIGGFEAATLAEGTYDLILSNVPFGRYGVMDNRNRPYSRASIHNWFVGRALDVLRPGGLVCFITSTYFLDESDAGMRAHVASEADLVTAFRLPSGTFERIASTSVQADLVVLRKRAPGEATAAAEWLDLDYVPKTMLREGCHEQYLRINRWFVRHPEHVLGRIDRVSNGFQAVPTAMLDGDLESALLGAQAGEMSAWSRLYQDNFDRIQADDMKQAATIIAAFAYQTAMMDGKLPRKTIK